jgi:predicted lipoprotein
MPLARILALTLALAIAAPAQADFPETLRDHILPGVAAFREATAALAEATTASCDPQSLRPPYQAAFDAWMGISHLRIGPAEEDGHALAIAFWPDPKGLGWKQQQALLTGDPAALEPQAFARQSVAARGLFGLERLLYPTEPLPADPCPLIRATATDLARMAAEIDAAWTGGYAEAMLTAGAPGNTLFLGGPEVRQALFTLLYTGLEFDGDQRLGRPMGEPSRATPAKAEAIASGRSLRNVLISLQSLRGMLVSLTPDAPRTAAAFDHAISLAKGLDDPVFAGVATPEGRLRVEILQQAISHIREVALLEAAPELDVGIGFNAADGD